MDAIIRATAPMFSELSAWGGLRTLFSELCSAGLCSADSVRRDSVWRIVDQLSSVHSRVTVPPPPLWTLGCIVKEVFL